MAEDDPSLDEDESRAIIALRAMDEKRRRKMVERLEKMAKTQSEGKVRKLQLVSKNAKEK